MSTVLWGARRGDVHYASYGYWQRNIPIGASIMEVGSSVYFRPRMMVDVAGQTFTLSGIEPGRLGIGGLRNGAHSKA